MLFLTQLGEPVKPTATSDAVFNALVDGMQHRRSAGPAHHARRFQQPDERVGQGQDVDIQYRGRRATLDDMAIYQATEQEMTGLKFNRIFRPGDPNHYVISSFLEAHGTSAAMAVWVISVQHRQH